MVHDPEGNAPTATDSPDSSTTASRSVASRIRRAMDDLSPSERRVARALLSHFPAAGLETTALLAERAGVSGPTVVRFVSRLGYSGYREFQAELRDEIQARGASPVALAGRGDERTGAGTLGERAAQVFHTDLAGTFENLPDGELKQAVEMLADPRYSISCVGGRFSGVLAEYLWLHLRQMRPRTRILRIDDTATELVDAGRDQTLVVFDYRRYQEDVVAFARAMAARGARIVLVTDPWLSPVAEVATVVLPAHIDAPSPFDSYVAPLALVETLVAGVHARLGASATRRMLEYENAAGRLGPA